MNDHKCWLQFLTGSIPPTDFLASNWEWWETMIMTIATFTLARREAPPFQQGSMWDKWALKRRAVAKRDICSWRPANILGHGTSTGRVHCGRFFFHEIGWKAWCCTRMNAAVSVPAADRCFLEIHFNFSVLVTWRGKKSSTNQKNLLLGVFLAARYWCIQSGIMKVYKTVGPDYTGEPHRLYDIREATCKFETRDMMGLHEPFLGNYQARVRLLLKERTWGPVFLYSKDLGWGWLPVWWTRGKTPLIWIYSLVGFVVALLIFSLMGSICAYSIYGKYECILYINRCCNMCYTIYIYTPIWPTRFSLPGCFGSEVLGARHPHVQIFVECHRPGGTDWCTVQDGPQKPAISRDSRVKLLHLLHITPVSHLFSAI